MGVGKKILYTAVLTSTLGTAIYLPGALAIKYLNADVNYETQNAFSRRINTKGGSVPEIIIEDGVPLILQTIDTSHCHTNGLYERVNVNKDQKAAKKLIDALIINDVLDERTKLCSSR